MEESSRNSDQELELQWKIVDGFLSVRNGDGVLSIPKADEIYAAVIEGVQVDGLPLVQNDELISGLTFSKFPLLPKIVIEVSEKESTDTLCVGVYANNKITSVALNDISDKAPDHMVSGGRWYPLAPGGLEEVRNILHIAGITSIGPITLKQFLKLRSVASEYPIITDNSGEAANASNLKAAPDFSPASIFTGSLFPYQKDGLRWLGVIASQEIGGILADEMGLGKTIQIVALFAAECAENRVPSLVVAPGTLLENWRREIGRFTSTLVTHIHRGYDRTGFPDELRENDVVITSYDTLVRDLSMFRAINWNIVVLDEAQAIKNPETRRASAVKRLSRRVGIAVTGTPVENCLRDLWSITDFVAPNFLGNQASFEKMFQDDAYGASSLEPLVSPILLRRRVADVAGDLPERIDIPQILELSPKQADAYENERQKVLNEYGERATLVALTRLRMFCAHPLLVGTSSDDPAQDSPKYLRLTEILQEIFDNGEKAILFTSFTEMADILVSDISRRFGVPATFIDGRVPIENRQNVVDEFSAFHGGALLVLNPRAAGTGLNITAANHVIHYNLEWNPAVEDQASARAHRRGQTKPVTVHRLFYLDTVEEVVDDRLARKRDLAITAVIGTDGREEGVDDIIASLRKSPVGVVEYE